MEAPRAPAGQPMTTPPASVLPLSGINKPLSNQNGRSSSAEAAGAPKGSLAGAAGAAGAAA